MFFRNSKQTGIFPEQKGLGREGAIPCHVASKNKKGNSLVSFVLEGVTDRGRQKGPPHFSRAKKGFRIKKGNRSIKGKAGSLKGGWVNN